MSNETSKIYMHVKTGSIDTRDGWISSYDKEELENRGITADDAFDVDEGDTLIEVKKDEFGNWVER